MHNDVVYCSLEVDRLAYILLQAQDLAYPYRSINSAAKKNEK